MPKGNSWMLVNSSNIAQVINLNSGSLSLFHRHSHPTRQTNTCIYHSTIANHGAKSKRAKGQEKVSEVDDGFCFTFPSQSSD